MTDWSVGTGQYGSLILRLTGNTLQAIIHNGYSGTYVNGGTGTIHVGAGAAAFTFSVNGVQDVVVWQGTLGAGSTAVSFTMNATGTQGLGGPTTLSVTINTANVPSAPGTPTVSSITNNRANVNFSAPANNGAAIDEYQIQYSTSSSYSSYSAPTGSGSPIAATGLAAVTTYYVRVRAHNSVGWGAWSGSRSFKTLGAPATPTLSSVDQITQTSARINFSDGANNGAGIDSRQIAYNTSNTTSGATVVTGNSGTVISGLDPNVTYYFWARTHNTYGYSAWSAVKSAATVAGAYVRVGGTWTKAVPYVKVDGEWVLAQPYVRVSGAWKATT